MSMEADANRRRQVIEILETLDDDPRTAWGIADYLDAANLPPTIANVIRAQGALRRGTVIDEYGQLVA